MFVTEAEAKEKQCRSVIMLPVDTPQGLVPMGTMCIASQCMAWRLATTPVARTRRCGLKTAATDQEARTHEAANGGEFPPPGWEFYPAGTNGDAFWMEPAAQVQARVPGYCGLAGRPNHVG